MERGRAGSLGSLRESNRDRVIATLRSLGVASQADIARGTGLSRTTVSSLVAELREAGTVIDHDEPGPAAETGPGARGGRPPTLLALDRSLGVAVGIDFGKRHLAVAAADLSHTIVAEVWREMPDDYAAREALDATVDLFDEVLERAGVGRGAVAGVALGAARADPRADRQRRLVLDPPRLGRPPGRGRDDAAALRLPVRVDNDANLGALAELRWGAGRGCSDLVYLKVATGIGAGLVVAGGAVSTAPAARPARSAT